MGAIQMTQVNTRIPVELKRQGDEVLARFGATTSDVVRALWQYMATYQRIPDIGWGEEPAKGDFLDEKIREIEAGSTLVANYYASMGFSSETVSSGGHDGDADMASYRDMRDAMYEELLDEYEALHA